jgi:hypothetical protein
VNTTSLEVSRAFTFGTPAVGVGWIMVGATVSIRHVYVAGVGSLSEARTLNRKSAIVPSARFVYVFGLVQLSIHDPACGGTSSSLQSNSPDPENSNVADEEFVSFGGCAVMTASGVASMSHSYVSCDESATPDGDLALTISL